MIIITGKQNNQADIKNLWDKCFDEDSTHWRNWYFDNIFQLDNAICAKQDNSLISMVHMNPYPIFMHHSKIDAFALSGVATEKECRGRGYAGNLIKYALNKGYKLGYDFSFLYPFKYEYYQKFGYSLGYYKYKYNVICNDKIETSKLVIKDEYSLAELAKIYAGFIKDKNGFVLRNAEYMDVHIKELECDNKVVCFEINSNKGYYAINSSEDVVEELVFDGDISTAMKEIVRHYQKSISFDNLYDVDSMIGKREKHCMGRVVSVERMLNKMKMKNADTAIRIRDEIIEENNGVWHIKSENGRTKIKKTDLKPDYTLDISELTPIITGLESSDEKIIEIQKLLFNDSIPYIYEVC